VSCSINEVAGRTISLHCQIRGNPPQCVTKRRLAHLLH
jgi:hypothetical protein